jgi:hypothetical protein
LENRFEFPERFCSLAENRALIKMPNLRPPSHPTAQKGVGLRKTVVGRFYVDNGLLFLNKVASALRLDLVLTRILGVPHLLATWSRTRAYGCRPGAERVTADQPTEAQARLRRDLLCSQQITEQALHSPCYALGMVGGIVRCAARAIVGENVSDAVTPLHRSANSLNLLHRRASALGVEPARLPAPEACLRIRIRQVLNCLARTFRFVCSRTNN